MKAKKFLWVLLACVLALSLAAFAACGDGDKGGEETVPATAVAVSPETASVEVGKTVTLTATVTPADSTDEVKWFSDHTEIATVNGGVVTGVAKGTAVITAKAGEKSASCTVTVTEAEPTVVPVEGVTLDKTELTLYVNGEAGQDTATLTATVTPDTATDKTVAWASNDDETVTVANGVVTAVKAGTATVTATAGEKSASCAVTVIDAANIVKVTDAAGLLAAVENSENEGKTIELAAGTYALDKAVRITQDLTLAGAAEDTVVLQPGDTPWTNDTGSKGYASVVTVSGGADVTVRNLTVQNAKNITMTGAGSGTDYGSGFNLAQAGSVVLENVTVKDNAAAGIVVNKSVATLKNVATSGNGWGGVNVDITSGSGEAPAAEIVLTVDGACEFAEAAAIYSDSAANTEALAGKLDLPDTFFALTTGGGTVWTDKVTEDTTVKSVTIGGKAYVVTYATNGDAVTNNDPSGDSPWDFTYKSGITNVRDDFAVVYTWTSSRDKNYTNVVLELFVGEDYFDLTVGDPADTGIWGDLTTVSGVKIEKTLTIDSETQSEWTALGTEGAFAGEYEALIARVGSTLLVQVTFVNEAGNVYVYTYTFTGFTQSAITAQLTGNTFWVDNITVDVGTIAAVTAAD